MKKLMIFTCTVSILFALALGILAAKGAWAQTTNPMPTITLVTDNDKTTYTAAEPIRMQINVSNTSGANLVTHKGFMDGDFHLMITFTDPDGQLIQSKFIPVADEPGPPFVVQSDGTVLGAAAPVEVILDGWERGISPDTRPLVVIEDAHVFYDLPKLGVYTAQVIAPFEKFSACREESSPTIPIDPATYNSTSNPPPAGLISLLEDDKVTATYDHRVLSNLVRFEIVSAVAAENDRSPVEVLVDIAEVGGGPTPSVTLSPLNGVSVKLYRVSDIPEDYYPLNHKSYSLVATDTSIPVVASSKALGGTCSFENIRRDDYLVIGEYSGSPDFNYVGDKINANDPAWGTGPIDARLRIMIKANGKKVPTVKTKRTGSLLIITEPEFVAWDSEQELYPFIFESVGDWGVSTSVAPPEGFVTDYKELSANVNSETEAVQFTITDEGSSWKETDVTFTLTHNKKKEKIKTKIGVKLNKKLAEEKGLGVYGDTESPGDFKDGKKIKEK